MIVHDSAASTGLVEALHVTSPAPEYRDKLMLFGRFVGTWTIAWAGAPSQRATGELHFGWALAGRTVQDIWIVPGPGQPGRRGCRRCSTAGWWRRIKISAVFHASSRRNSRSRAAASVIRRKTNRRHMIGDHHGRTAGGTTLLVRAVDAILGTHPAGCPGAGRRAVGRETFG